MRLAAQVKGGYYPAATEAIDSLLTRLVCPEPDATMILDPCCGRGKALAHLGRGLGVPRANHYAIELDLERGREAAATLEGGHLLQTTDFLGTEITARSFSLLWLNPPFDDELGGGKRVEMMFLSRATPLLATRGILCFVLPASVLEAKSDIRHYLLGWYHDLNVVPFPEDYGPFKEVCVFGVKRSSSIDGSKLQWPAEVKYDEPGEYELPPAGGQPRRFLKSAFTQEEMAQVLCSSRLNRVLGPPAPLPVPRPGLQLGQGQQALVLAGGFLNRVLQLDNQPPILIKATPYKAPVLKSSTTEEMEDGGTKTVIVNSQKIGLLVRVLDVDGVIHTLKDKEDDPTKEEEPQS